MKLYIGRRLKHSERGRGGRGLGGRGMVKLASRPLRPSMSEAVLSKISVPELTPRSALACKLHGVDPRELLPLSPDTFREFGERKEAEQLRYEAYEAARKETFELVRSERERILHGRPLEPTSPLRRSATERSSLCSNFTDSSLSTSSTHRFPEASMSMGRGVDVVRERRTLEKMRKRTTNSIELMLMNEIRMIKARDEEQERVNKMHEEDKRRRLERKLKSEEWAKARLKHEQEKIEEEKQEMARARKVHLAEMARDAEFSKKQEEKKVAIAKEAAQRQAEMLRKKEKSQRSQEELLQQREEELALRSEENRRREQERLRRLDQEKQRVVAENARQKQLAFERVAALRAAQAEEIHQRREMRRHKMELEERRRELAQEQQRMEVEARRRAAEERLRRAQGKRRELGIEMAAGLRLLSEKERRESELVHSLREAKMRQVRSKAMQRELVAQTHRMRTERRFKREENEREMVSQKIKMGTQRTSDMLRAKEDFVARCQRTRVAATARKDAFARKIEGMRSASSFDLPPEMREFVADEGLRDFIARCGELSKQHGGRGVPAQALAALVRQMEFEGKLQLKPAHVSPIRSHPSSPAKRPFSAPGYADAFQNRSRN